jgi:hypothetical protein
MEQRFTPLPAGLHDRRADLRDLTKILGVP